MYLEYENFVMPLAWPLCCFLFLSFPPLQGDLIFAPLLAYRPFVPLLVYRPFGLLLAFVDVAAVGAFCLLPSYHHLTE